VIQLDKFIEQSIIKKSKGIALITVMLIVSLCAIIAAQMTTRLHMQMQRSTNINFNQQAYWYAMGAEAFAKRVLLTTVKKDKDTINWDKFGLKEKPLTLLILVLLQVKLAICKVV
jgi:general secretion pathway protein K